MLDVVDSMGKTVSNGFLSPARRSLRIPWRCSENKSQILKYLC